MILNVLKDVTKYRSLFLAKFSHSNHMKLYVELDWLPWLLSMLPVTFYGRSSNLEKKILHNLLYSGFVTSNIHKEI